MYFIIQPNGMIAVYNNGIKKSNLFNTTRQVSGLIADGYKQVQFKY